jgi:peptidyl-tRNA hydrolase
MINLKIIIAIQIFFISLSWAEKYDFTRLTSYLSMPPSQCQKALDNWLDSHRGGSFNESEIRNQATKAQEDRPIYLVVGLGNSNDIEGQRNLIDYNTTPHNMGFHFINHILNKVLYVRFNEAAEDDFTLEKDLSFQEVYSYQEAIDFKNLEDAESYVQFSGASILANNQGQLLEKISENIYRVLIRVGGDVVAINNHGRFTNSSQIIFVKPKYDINESGDIVGALSKKFNIPTERILVFTDDLDIPRGQVKMKRGHPKEVSQNTRGIHNGIKSINENLGQSDYFRFRIGIGRPPKNEDGTPSMPIMDWVLRTFREDDNDYELQQSNFKVVSKALEEFVNGRPQKSMEITNQ